MSTDNAQKFRDAFVASFAPDMNSTATALVDKVLNQEFKYTVTHPFEANASSFAYWSMDQNTGVAMLCKSFKVIPSVTITGANTNVAIMALVYNNGNGGADTTIYSVNTAAANSGGSGDITANIAYSFTANTSNVRIPAGSQILLKVTKAGAGGLALPACTFEFKAAPTA